MSIKATNQVRDHSKQKNGALLVLLTIANYVNEERGGAWPGVPTIARDARMSERQVQRHIRDLERAGELEVIPNGGPNGTNFYKIICGVTPHAQDSGDISDTAVVTSLASGGDTSDTQSVKEPLKEPLRNTPIVPKGDDSEFWIRISFQCFNQSIRFLPQHILRNLKRFASDLEKKHGSSLLAFYHYETPLERLQAPYSSRRHSPERLILDLPRQLALAIQTCAPVPTPAKKEEPPRWVEFFRWKYPECRLPESYYELDLDQCQEYQREFQKFVSVTGEPDRTDPADGDVRES